jgi:hypothetical protein
MEEKGDDIFYEEQTKWYMNVLYYLNRVMYPYQYYHPRFNTQLCDGDVDSHLDLNDYPRDEWWKTALIDNRRLVKLFYFCTLKMFMVHNEAECMRWLQVTNQRDFLELQYQWNEEIRDLLFQLEWWQNSQGDSEGVAYLKHYFEFCMVKEREYFRSGVRLNTILLECITPEFYKYLGDHIALILESFQQDLLYTSEPGWVNLYTQVQQWLRPNVVVSALPREQHRMVYRVQHAQEVSALIALLVDVRGFLTLDFEDDETDDKYYADLQIRQYQTDRAMLNEQRPRVRRSNLEKIRDRYNARSL